MRRLLRYAPSRSGTLCKGFAAWQAPSRHAPGGARAVCLAHARGGFGDGGGGALGARRRARQAGRAGRRRRGRAPSRPSPATSRAGASSWRTRWMPSGWRWPAAVRSTSAPRRAASPTACCSAARARWSRVDVGYGELDCRLRNDPRVRVLERTNARALEPAMLPWARPEPSDLATIDVSFISLAKVLGAVLGCLGRRAMTCSRWSSRSSRSGAGASGKGGVVRDAAERRGRSSARARPRSRWARRARLPLLGAAGAEGQPRDVRVAGRPGRARRRARDRAGALERLAREVEP